jgi:hypothetical protein
LGVRRHRREKQSCAAGWPELGFYISQVPDPSTIRAVGQIGKRSDVFGQFTQNATARSTAESQRTGSRG